MNKENNMEKIPTAEEHLKKYHWKTLRFGKTLMKEAMIEFAKLHVRAAKKAIDRDVELEYALMDPYAENGYCPIIDMKLISKAYPEENIK